MTYVFLVARCVRLFRLPPKPSPISACILRHLSAAVPSASPEPKPSLSARLSLVFDQIDALERQRDIASKDEALQRIRAWRQTKDPITPHPPSPSSVSLTSSNEGSGLGDAQVTDEKDPSKFGMRELFRREVELVHPWPEWIELMERLASQNYFDYRRVEEEHIAANVGIDLSGVRDEVGLDLSRDWAAVRTACMNFGRDRFDILKSLSRKDIQTLVGHGCPSMDPKVVFSAKLLRKYVHVDEGDVCSSCTLRNTCSRGYLLVPKEDEARTLDVMRILLTYGFDQIKESVANTPLRKMKTLKTVVRKLLHEVVKLSAVPRDPNLLPPVIKKPPPKVKQPPPQPKRRVGRDDVEMKKGDWLCTKCDFMNFAKNTVCLQCDAKRPKRQLLPGEWECPKCNFLNYRRNMSCFQCEHTRPTDEFTENQMQGKRIGPTTRLQRAVNTSDVSNAWNLAFDDDESDGADVAAFEFADSSKARDGSFDEVPRGGSVREVEGDDGMQNPDGGRYFSTPRKGGFSSHSHATGFDDFDDEEDDGVDNYELDKTDGKGTRVVSQNCLSEFDDDSGLENCDRLEDYVISKQSGEDYLSDSEDDDIRATPQKIEDSGRQFKFGDEDLFDSDHDVRDNRGLKGQKVGQRNIGVKGSLKRRDSSFSDGLLDSDFDDEDDDIDDLSPNRSKMKGNRGVAKRKVRNIHDSNHFGSKGNGRNYCGRDDDVEENDVHSRRKGHGDASERRGNRFRDINRYGSKNAPRNSVTRDDDESDDWEESGSKRRGSSSQFSQRARGFHDGIGLKRNGHRHKDDHRYSHSARMVGHRRTDYAQNGRYSSNNGRSRGFREDHDFSDNRQRRRVIER